ncbi:hypothetical protein IKF33_02400 [Candidatus Saccharibacteria bacterium]|nr:hypothetical protein [Candidatus Saccharibacteria bacterium]
MFKKSSRRGQKLSQKISRFSRVASEASQEHIKENLVEKLPHARNVRLLILEWSLLMSVLILLAITQAFWYSDSNATNSYTSGGTYTEATIGEIKSFNPLSATTNSERVLSRLMFATLTANDYSGHTGVGLADSIKVNDVGDVWTLHLRDNLKWSDGEPITNDDVIFTVKLIQDANTSTSYSSNLSKVELAEDESGNLVFTLPTAYINFDAALEVPILPEHILKDTDPAKISEHNFSTLNPVTSGPFNYNASQIINLETGEQIVYLKSNPYYYGDEPLISTFAIHAFADADSVVKALNNGLVTATAELGPTDHAQITSKNIYERETAISNGVYAFINTSSHVLNNRSVRQALRQGINMDEIREPLGDELPLDYPILASQHTVSKYPEIPKYNLADAKDALSGIEFDRDTPISIITVSNGYLPALAENFKSAIEKLGLKAEVMVYDADQDFLAQIVRPRNYDILLYEVELGADTDLFAYYHSSQASQNGLNLSNYRNTLVDNIILSARNTMNQEQRANKYETFLNYWVSDVPAIGIYQPNMAYYFNKNTRSFSEDNHLVTTLDRFEDVNYWGAIPTKLNRTP